MDSVTIKLRAVRWGQKPSKVYSRREKKEVSRPVGVEPGTEFELEVKLIEKNGKMVPKIPRWCEAIEDVPVIQSEPTETEVRIEQQIESKVSPKRRKSKGSK